MRLNKKKSFSNILQLSFWPGLAWNSLQFVPFFSSCLTSSLGVGMRGVMRTVSADLPALIRTCLFDWKAVRSDYAPSGDHHGTTGDLSACV